MTSNELPRNHLRELTRDLAAAQAELKASKYLLSVVADAPLKLEICEQQLAEAREKLADELEMARSLIARSHVFADAKDTIAAAEDEINEIDESDIDIEDEEARGYSGEKQAADEATSLAEEMKDWLSLHPKASVNP